MGVINPGVYSAFEGLDYDLKSHYSKGLDELPEVKFDTVVLMGCGEDCPKIKAKKVIEWNVPDPKMLSQEDFDVIRDQIKDQVTGVLSKLEVLAV